MSVTVMVLLKVYLEMVCFSIFLVINIIKLKGKGDEQAILFKAKQLNRI